MGVEFSHVLIPSDNTYLPAASDVQRLIESWIDEGFLLRTDRGEVFGPEAPGGVETVGGHIAPVARSLHSLPNFTLNWWISPADAPRALPLQWPDDASLEGRYYELQILRSSDFTELRAGDLIAPLSTRCQCGTELRLPPAPHVASSDELIRSACPTCGTPFRPQDQTVDYQDPVTGEISPLRGGACFRFAIRIQAGKGLNPVPRIDGHLPRAAPAFLDLCQRALGQPLYEVGYLY